MKYQIAEMAEAIAAIQAIQMSFFLIPLAIAVRTMTPCRQTSASGRDKPKK